MSNPTLLVEQFDGSLGDFTGVDPVRYDDGLWLEQATTNLILNPSVEVDVAFINAQSGATRTRTASESAYGSASLQVDTPGVGLGEGAAFVTDTGLNVTGASVYSGSVAMMGTGTVRVWVRFSYTDASSDNNQSGDITLTGEFVRYTLENLVPNPAKTLNQITVFGRTASTQAITFYMDGAQVEAGEFATSYTDGSLGDGYASVGTLWATAHTRAASSASISPSGILTPDSGSLAFRITPTIETGVEEIWGECGIKGSGTDHARWGRDASTHPFVEWSSNDAAYQRLTGTETISVNTEYLFYLGWNGVLTELSIDAGTKHTGTRDVVEDDFSVGDLTLEASAGGVIVSPFATFDRPLTDTEIATLAARQGWSMSTLDSTTRRIRAQFELRPAY